MPFDSEFVALAVTGAVVAAIFSYGAYWGLRVRDALHGRLYRERALWTAVVGMVFSGLVVSNIVIGELAPSNFSLSVLQFFLQYSGAVLTFASVDATIRVAIATDPLGRDTLHWRFLRMLLWVVVAVSAIAGFAGVLYYQTNFYTSSGGPQGVLIYGPFGNLLALIALVVARSRSKDYTLRRHMKWFALFVAVLLVASSDPFYRYSQAHIGVSLLLVLAAFFLYMSSKSLVPVSGWPPPRVGSPVPLGPSKDSLRLSGNNAT